jgi:hypothetical protein
MKGMVDATSLDSFVGYAGQYKLAMEKIKKASDGVNADISSAASAAQAETAKVAATMLQIEADYHKTAAKIANTSKKSYDDLFKNIKSQGDSIVNNFKAGQDVNASWEAFIKRLTTTFETMKKTSVKEAKTWRKVWLRK